MLYIRPEQLTAMEEAAWWSAIVRDLETMAATEMVEEWEQSEAVFARAVVDRVRKRGVRDRDIIYKYYASCLFAGEIFDLDGDTVEIVGTKFVFIDAEPSARILEIWAHLLFESQSEAEEPREQ